MLVEQLIHNNLELDLHPSDARANIFYLELDLSNDQSLISSVYIKKKKDNDQNLIIVSIKKIFTHASLVTINNFINNYVKINKK